MNRPLPDPPKQADATLARVADRLQLFHHVNPVNAEEEKKIFLETRRAPRFTYPSLSFDPRELLDVLAGAPMGAIEDSTLRGLFEDKRDELDTTVRLLAARGTPAFREHSEALYGVPPADLVCQAERILARSVAEPPQDLEAKQVCAMLEDHIRDHQRRDPGFVCRVEIAPNLSSNMYVHHDHVRVREGARFSVAAAACDMHHEIDAHVLTWLNGCEQPLALFRVGLAGTMAFQESLGVFTEMAAGVFWPGRARSLAARAAAVGWMAGGADFRQVFERLEGAGLGEQDAFQVCQRVFRGGGFTKDWVYVARLKELVRAWAAGCDLHPMLLGKVTLDAHHAVCDLLDRGLLHPPRFLPLWMDHAGPPVDLQGPEPLSLERMFACAPRSA